MLAWFTVWKKGDLISAGAPIINGKIMLLNNYDIDNANTRETHAHWC